MFPIIVRTTSNRDITVIQWQCASVTQRWIAGMLGVLVPAVEWAQHTILDATQNGVKGFLHRYLCNYQQPTKPWRILTFMRRRIWDSLSPSNIHTSLPCSSLELGLDRLLHTSADHCIMTSAAIAEIISDFQEMCAGNCYCTSMALTYSNL